MNAGVSGGDGDLQSFPDMISVNISPSQPDLMPATAPRIEKVPLTGVGSRVQLEGGLLLALPETDKGGVVGPHSVSSGYKDGDGR